MSIDVGPDLGRALLPDHVLDLWSQRRVSTLGVVRRDGTPHLTPVKSMLDAPGTGPGARVLVLTRLGTVKARVVGRTGHASVAEHTPDADWATLEGPARVSTAPPDLARARELYAARYGEQDTWGTCVLVVAVERVLTGHGARTVGGAP